MLVISAMMELAYMVGLRSGLATQILDKSPKAFLIHCFAHALNLSVNDMVRQIPFLDNIM